MTSKAALSALGLSLGTGLIATVLCIVVGVPLALFIARSGPRLAAVLRAAVTVPLVLPPMVGGVALLYLFGRAGWLGGLGLSFSTPAVVLAQTFVALPFLVLAVEGAVRTSGVDYERTAAALGAFALVLAATRYASLASISGTVTLAGLAFLLGYPGSVARAAAATGLLVLWKHRGNLERLARGTESRVGSKTGGAG